MKYYEYLHSTNDKVEWSTKMLNILPKITLKTAVTFQTQKKKKKDFTYTQVYYTTLNFLNNAVKSGMDTDILMLNAMPSPNSLAVVHLYIVMKTPLWTLMKEKESSPHKKDTYANVCIIHN